MGVCWWRGEKADKEKKRAGLRKTRLIENALQ